MCKVKFFERVGRLYMVLEVYTMYIIHSTYTIRHSSGNRMSYPLQDLRMQMAIVVAEIKLGNFWLTYTFENKSLA